MKAEQWI